MEGRLICLSECDRSLNVVDHCHAHLYEYAHATDQLCGTIDEAVESQNNTRQARVNAVQNIACERLTVFSHRGIKIIIAQTLIYIFFIYYYYVYLRFCLRRVNVTISTFNILVVEQRND